MLIKEFVVKLSLGLAWGFRVGVRSNQNITKNID
jgi:hypothetical protein